MPGQWETYISFLEYDYDEYKYSSYDSPTTSMENLTRKSDNVTIFSHINGVNSFSN